MASSIFVCLMHHDDEKLEKLLEVVKNWLKEYEVSWSANNNDTLEISNWEEGREEGDRCADVNSINFRLLNSGNAKGLAELISENGLDGTIMRASLERDRYTRKYIEMCIDGEWREIYSSQPENDFIEEVRISFCDDEYLKVYLDKIRKKISQTLSGTGFPELM